MAPCWACRYFVGGCACLGFCVFVIHKCTAMGVQGKRVRPSHLAAGLAEAAGTPAFPLWCTEGCGSVAQGSKVRKRVCTCHCRCAKAVTTGVPKQSLQVCQSSQGKYTAGAFALDCKVLAEVGRRSAHSMCLCLMTLTS